MVMSLIQSRDTDLVINTYLQCLLETNGDDRSRSIK